MIGDRAWIATGPSGRVLHLGESDGWSVDQVMGEGPFVVVDVGCLECHMATYIVGVFMRHADAEAAAAARRKRGDEFRTDRAVLIFGPGEFGMADQ